MTGDSRLRFGVLGTFRVERDGQQADLGPRLQRTLLAILLVDAGHVVPVDRLIDLIWRDGPPAAAIASVQAYVSQLRRVLEPGRLPRAPAITFNRGIAMDQMAVARFRYANFVRKPASACIQCRECEEKCPQGLPIGDWMPYVDRVLGQKADHDPALAPVSR